MKNIDIVKIKMVKDRETEKKYKAKITNPGDAYDILRDLLEDEDRENFLVLTLNCKNEINAINTVSVGTLSSSVVHPREVFKVAILSNSSKIMLVHNHPSGDVEPSNADKMMTHRLIESGKILGIEIIDHIIIGDTYYSFRENGDF